MNFVFSIIKDFLLSVSALAGIVLSIFNIRYIKKQNKAEKTMSFLTDLYSHYKEIMKKIPEASAEAKKLEKYLIDCKDKEDFSDFNDEYYSDKFNNFRDIHYFFELLGVMIRHKEINKYPIWHYFSFPIDYFLKTENIRNLITKNDCLPSYAENFCRLFVLYNYGKRTKDPPMPWIANGKRYFLTPDQVKTYSDNYNFEEIKEDTKKKGKNNYD